MKYQASADMTFDRAADLNTVVTYIWGKRGLGFIMPGDELNISITPEGYFRVRVVFRFDASAERDALLDQMENISSRVCAGTNGYIESHDCMHDDGGACINLVQRVW